jgi:hypothetical protein
MNYNEFTKALHGLKAFIQEREKLQGVLDVISPSSTGVVEFGNSFIDAYMKLLSRALGDENEWVEWFVYENDFGAKGMEVICNGVEYPITDEKTFYDVCICMVEREDHLKGK